MLSSSTDFEYNPRRNGKHWITQDDVCRTKEGEAKEGPISHKSCSCLAIALLLANEIVRVGRGEK